VRRDTVAAWHRPRSWVMAVAVAGSVANPVPPPVWACRHYVIEDTIGAGNFAEVKKCAHRETGQPYAVKVIEKRRVDPKRRDKILESECDALRRVKHPNIVALHEIFDTPEKLYIVMEVRGALTSGCAWPPSAEADPPARACAVRLGRRDAGADRE
jgi:serine/threonine protein kinase